MEVSAVFIMICSFFIATEVLAVFISRYTNKTAKTSIVIKQLLETTYQ